MIVPQRACEGGKAALSATKKAYAAMHKVA
jgi:hypothetical protein